MKNIGQIQPAKKPAKYEINCAYQHSSPRPQMSWGGIHASQHIRKNNQIAGDIVYFHGLPVALFKQKSQLLSNNKFEELPLRFEPAKIISAIGPKNARRKIPVDKLSAYKAETLKLSLPSVRLVVI
jgi:hypothetical protein